MTTVTPQARLRGEPQDATPPIAGIPAVADENRAQAAQDSELLRQLQSLPVERRKQIVQQAVENGAMNIQSERTAVDPRDALLDEILEQVPKSTVAPAILNQLSLNSWTKSKREWLAAFETMATLSSWNEATRKHVFLASTCLYNAVWTQSVINQPMVAIIASFRKEFVEEADLLTVLSRQQRAGQSVREYWREKMSALQLLGVDPTHAKEALLQGLRTELRAHATVLATCASTEHDILEALTTLERNAESKSEVQAVRQVSFSSPLKRKRDARSPQRNFRAVTCWSCGRKG
ncbi:MAG: hypothetical protein ACK8QZ_10435, partial [Anaerolineales bacterium]